MQVQQVRCNAATQRIQNVDFIFCPRERKVKVRVPVRVLNGDISAGVRKGGWIHIRKRTVQVECLGADIPASIEVNVKALDVNQSVSLKDLVLPPQAKLLRGLDGNDVVLKCTLDSGDEVKVRGPI